MTNMLKEILKGESPSRIFRRMIDADASIENIRLAQLLSDEFSNLSGEARQLVWHWKGPGKVQGLSDADLDASILDLLHQAGYL
jgi:hypothetical protein